jgi:hypothetical protein
MNVSLPPSWTLLALALSSLALLVSYLNFRRKSSLKLRASYSWVSSSEAADDQHLSSIVIENLKDRAVTIFAIYLRVGHNYYVKVENFEDKPLILRAFETWHKEYGPIEFYGINTQRIAMNSLFADKRARKRIVLSTSDGKYVVTKAPKHWDPVYDFFNNHMTAIVWPVRGTYKGTAIGGRVLYVVDIVLSSGETEIISIHSMDYEVQRFKNFRLTKESLASADALKKYLQQQVDTGLLVCRSFEVIDLNEWRAKERDYKGQPIEARYSSYFKYKLLGRVATILAKLKLRKQNRANQKRKHSSKIDT